MNLANHMAYDRKLFSYAVGIAQIVLQFEKYNFYVLNDLLKYYGLKGDQAGTLGTAKQIKELVNVQHCKPEFAVYLFSKLLSACMATNDWGEVESLSQRLQDSLDNLLKKPNVILDNFLSGRFWALGFSLLYLFDNPPIIRRYLNQVADIFQTDCIKREDIKQTPITPTNIQNNRKLKRIGYIAHTLRKHSVGWLVRWLFKYHDRQRYEIYAYLIGQGEDELTKEWIYPPPDEQYMEWGVRLGQDRDLRRRVQERLRSARQDSPLWQGERFTREMERAFDTMWEGFCGQNGDDR